MCHDNLYSPFISRHIKLCRWEGAIGWTRKTYQMWGYWDAFCCATQTETESSLSSWRKTPEKEMEWWAIRRKTTWRHLNMGCGLTSDVESSNGLVIFFLKGQKTYAVISTLLYGKNWTPQGQLCNQAQRHTFLIFEIQFNQIYNNNNNINKYIGSSIVKA